MNQTLSLSKILLASVLASACTASNKGAPDAAVVRDAVAEPSTTGDTAVTDSATGKDTAAVTDAAGIDLGALPSLPASTGAATFAMPGRSESDISVVVPAGIAAGAPLVISFHPTGGSESEGISQFKLEENAETYRFIAIAPRAGYRSGSHPADVDHGENGGGSSWNMWDLNPATNEDLRYVLALIEAARRTYGVDTSRVYTMGFSNGAFFSYFVAAALPSAIAGFAENSGGWTTDACPTRYDADTDQISFYPGAGGVGAGTAIACSTLFAKSAFPTKCRVTATNRLRPPTAGARVPFGYLAHYTTDSIVSVMWSCILSEALGNRVQTTIRASDTDQWGSYQDHSNMPDFFSKAWAFFANRTNAQ